MLYVVEVALSYAIVELGEKCRICELPLLSWPACIKHNYV